MSKVSGKVTKVESKGLYIKLENGKDAFLPKENMFIGKKKKLEEIFSVFVRLVLIFKEGKIRVFGYKKRLPIRQ